MDKKTKSEVWNGIKEGVQFVGTVAVTIGAIAGAVSALKGGNKK